MISILILLVLILFNALYVAAEFAAVSVSKPRLQQLADEGSAAAKKLLPILSDSHSLDRYVAACQVGITLSSLILGAYGQDVLSDWFAPLFVRFNGMEIEAAEGAAAVAVLIGLTAFQMVLGELLPKSLALQAPANVVLALARPMIWSLKILHPFIVVLNGSGMLFLRLLRVPQTAHRHVHSAAEMAMLFSESREGGLIEKIEHERLSQALQLEERKVAEIMVPRAQMKALDIDSPLETVLSEMGDNPYTRWPVYQGGPDRIVGIAHARDVARLALDPNKKFDLRKVVRKPLVVHDGMTADDLLSIMRLEHKQLAIVIDEFGTPVGVVGISDVLDELMGDIHEKSRMDPDTLIARHSDGRISLPGLLRLDEAAQWIGKEWRSENAITVAGRILEECGTLPAVGENFTIEGVEVEVERVNALSIESILVRPRKLAVEETQS